MARDPRSFLTPMERETVEKASAIIKNLPDVDSSIILQALTISSGLALRLTKGPRG